MPALARHQEAGFDPGGSWSDEATGRGSAADVDFPRWTQCGMSGSRRQEGSHNVGMYSGRPSSMRKRPEHETRHSHIPAGLSREGVDSHC